MRTPFVAVLAIGGLLALGAWTDPDQSTAAASAEPAQVADQQAGALCAPVQATANAHRRRSQARDQVSGRSYNRPRASSARPSDAAECAQSWAMVRRDAQRAQRNAAIDRSLNSGR